MNWLAHLFLSEPDVEMRLGNLLADTVKGSARHDLNPQIQRGIKCHQIIDQFTDNHTIVQRSKQRLYPEYRRFSGVIVDVFYDHFLAKNWSSYTNMTLDDFTTEIYTSFQDYQGQIPYITRQFITRVVDEDWLGAYRQIAGVENTLIRISKRLTRRMNRHFMLHLAVSELTKQYQDFDQDFQEFFPELILYVQNYY
ncbi:MAG TPA: ACP phosphodiesterase [Nostocaceae cyanobacterium]|nr:ACP phosphodiesterase [Nostocaceae cyanobacterium]